MNKRITFYTISCLLLFTPIATFASAQSSPHEGNWVLFLLLGLFGGLILFLFGMNLMSTGLQKSAGDKMRSILSTLTHNNFIGLSVGALVTMIIQSSSATSAMLVSFVNSGLMRFKQTIGILLGASIGTTITAQLIAFNLADYSLGIIAVGGALFMFSNVKSAKHLGETIFGFGILFFGMDIMSDSMVPLRSYEPFLTLIYSLENPILGIIVGACFTAIIQSSSAFIGIMIILAGQNLLTIESSIALLLGANLGTPITAILASIKTTTEAKRVALALLLQKVILAVLFVGFIPQLIDLLNKEGIFGADSLGRQIANAHTIFNVTLAILCFPFIKPFARFVTKILPSKTVATEEIITTKYLDKGMLNKPAFALQLAKEETIRLSSKIQVSLELILAPFIENNIEYLKNLEKQRDISKKIRDEIHSYLMNIKHSGESKVHSEELFTISHALTELSHINDSITKILHRRAEKWIDRHYEFSAAEREEILSFHRNTMQLFCSSIAVFKENSMNDTLKLNSINDKAKLQSQKALEIEKAHFERLLENEQTEAKNTKTYLELINMFKTIGNHSVNISKNVA